MGWFGGRERDPDGARNPWAGTRHESKEGRGGAYAGRYSKDKTWTQRHGWGARGLSTGAHNTRDRKPAVPHLVGSRGGKPRDKRSTFRGLGSSKPKARSEFRGLGTTKRKRK